MPEENGSNGTDELYQKIESLIDKQADGSTRRAVEILYSENKKLRDKKRELEKRVPGEDSVVISKEQKEKLDRYTELGSPENVENALEQRDTLKQEKQQLERERTLSEVASTLGWNKKVLDRLDDGYEYEKRTERDESGDASEIVYVAFEDEDGKQREAKLSNFAEERWSDFLPSLQQTDQQSGSDDTDSGSGFPSQDRGTQSSDDSLSVEEVREKKRQQESYTF